MINRVAIDKAEEEGVITRPLLCETCQEEKPLIRHHRDYDKMLDITWICWSCHRKEHAQNKYLKEPVGANGPRKDIKVSKRTHEIFRLEAVRQSMKPNTVVTIVGVADQYADKLNKKYKYIK